MSLTILTFYHPNTVSHSPKRRELCLHIWSLILEEEVGSPSTARESSGDPITQVLPLILSAKLGGSGCHIFFGMKNRSVYFLHDLVKFLKFHILTETCISPADASYVFGLFFHDYNSIGVSQPQSAGKINDKSRELHKQHSLVSFCPLWSVHG